MQLSIHNSTLKRVGFINNNLPDALHYFDDNWHRYLAEGTSTFDFSVNKINSSYALLTLQSYISFTYDGEDYLFNIINIEQDHYSMRLQCENLNLELISEEVGVYGNTKRHSIVWYLKNAAKITDDLVEIGNNPFPLVDEDVSNPILSFDNDETKLSRIISICKSFNAEFQFKTQLKNDGTLQNITIDLYKEGGVGQKRKDVTLYYGKNIAGITSKADRTSTFFNATTVTDSKNKFNWLSVEGEHYNSDGQLEFYKNAGDNTAYAPLSRDMFPSQLKSSSSDRYTRKNLSIEATSANSLWDYAVSQFKLFAYPQMSYEVSVAVNVVTNALGNDRRLDIGDTITVQDNTFDKSEGGLILSARVSEQEISFTNPQSNKIIFTNFVRLKSDISADLYGRMKGLVDQNTPYRFEVVTDNGLTFKNSTGSTTLTARVYKGSNIDEVSVDSFEWLLDGVSFGGTSKSQLVNASQVTGTSVVRYNAKLGETVIGGIEVTLQDVSDGTNGISPIVKINPDTSLTIVDAQGTSATPVLKGSDGANGTDGIAGKDGVGVKNTVITYAISTSGTTAPSTGWTSSVPSLVKGKYLWTKTVWTYTDNSSETGYSVTYISKDGNNGTDGIAGKDGTGIRATAITYAISTSGTTAPTTGWTSSVPSLVKGQYLWTKTVWAYTDNSSETGYSVTYISKDGNNGTDGLAGKDGVGIKTTTITYAGSTNGTTAPTSGWTSAVPTVAAGSYLWTKTFWAYTDNTTETGYSVARMGLKGDKGDPGVKGSDGTSGIIVSSVAPASPKTGQLWQDTSTTPQLVKKWTGSSWVIWELYAQNLKADKLETLSAKIGKIYNEFEYADTGSQNKGSITIENDIQFTTESLTNVTHRKTNISLSANTNFTGLMVQYLPNNDASGGHQTAYYTYGGIYMQDNINGWGGQITAENVTLVSWQNLILKSGYTTGDGVQPQYRRIKNLDGSYTVQFRGAISATSGNFPTTQVQVANIPEAYRPSYTAMRQGSVGTSNSTVSSARIAMTPSGYLHVSATSNTVYIYLDALTYVN